MLCDWAVLYLQDDLSLSGYKKHLTSQAAPLPLTAAEEELRQIKLNEVTHTHTHRQVIWILSLGHRLELSSSWRKRCSVQCLLHTCGHLLTSSLAWSVLKWVWIRLLVSLLALRHYHIGGFTGRKHWLALAQRYPSSLHILGVVGKSKPVQCRVSMKAGAEAFQTAQGQQQCKCAYACLAVSVQCRDADALEQQDVLMHREEIKLLAVCISLAPQNVLFRVVNTG